MKIRNWQNAARPAVLRGLCIAGALVLPASGVVAQNSQVAEGAAYSLAEPAYPATDPVSRVITVREIHFYDEAMFTPPVRLPQLPEGVSDQSTPERAMISRVSAIYQRDYDRFFQYWDEASQRIVEAELTTGAYTKEDLVGNWGVLNGMDIVLKRKITAGDYEILTYQFKVKGGDEGPLMEMPVIFKEQDGLWYATQDLRQDELIATSPWVSGENEVEFTVR
ncbi:MAG: hypothetical protein Tsb0010_05240 [Parvularculaceae bacterium]